MRAKTKIYHIECFRCSACARQLIPGKLLLVNAFKSLLIEIIWNIGDEFALRDGGSLYCKEDHDVLEKTSQTSLVPSLEQNNNNNNNTSISNNNHSSELGSMSGELF